MNNYNIKVKETQTELRLDIFLSQNLSGFSRNKIQALIKEGCVAIKLANNKKVITDCNYKVNTDEDYIITTANNNYNDSIEPYNYPLQILFEDEYILVINKPAGLVVHPGAGNKNNTLVNALVAKYGNKLSQLGGVERQGIVHRLDKDTSGVLLIAKTDYAHSKLGNQFAKHTIVRNYRALIWGVITPLNGLIDNIIGRSSQNRQKMAVLNNKNFLKQGQSFKDAAINNAINSDESPSYSRGKRAITIYSTLKITANKLFSLVDCSLKTGRTHQIRVHLSNLGHPVVADSLYGKKRSIVNNDFPTELTTLTRQALHAYKLEFIHPITNETMCFEAQEDKDLLQLYSKLFNN